MRELAFGPRKSGRTTTLIMTMIEEMEMHHKQVFLVVGKYCIGHHVKDVIKKLNGDSSRIKIVSLESLHSLRGTDPLNWYFEHTSYEFADSSQLRNLYMLEDMKDSMFFVNKIQ